MTRTKSEKRIGMGNKQKWVMGLDPSVTGTALVIFGPESFVYREEILTKASKWDKNVRGRMERYRHILERVEKLSEEHYPEYLLIEDYAYNAKGSAVTMGEVGGVLRYNIIDYFENVVEVAPTVLKKFATGKGNANKAAMVSSLSAKYRMKFQTDNEADAYALAKMGMIVAGYDKAETKYQEEAIKKLVIC